MTTPQQSKPFDPRDHLMQLKMGNRTSDYLPVQYRLVWVNDVCLWVKFTITDKFIDPKMPITKMVKVWNETTRKYEEKPVTKEGYAWFTVRVEDDQGNVGEAFKSESAVDFDDFAEKANTGAAGRALALIGYGTQFAPEFNEGDRIVDAPIEQKATPITTVSTATTKQKGGVTPQSTAPTAPTQTTQTAQPVAPVVATQPIQETYTPPAPKESLSALQQQTYEYLMEHLYGPYELRAYCTRWQVQSPDPASWMDHECSLLANVETLAAWVDGERHKEWEKSLRTEEQYQEILTFHKSHKEGKVVETMRDSHSQLKGKSFKQDFTKADADRLITMIRTGHDDPETGFVYDIKPAIYDKRLIAQKQNGSHPVAAGTGTQD